MRFVNFHLNYVIFYLFICQKILDIKRRPNVGIPQTFNFNVIFKHH
jgi:hypothetical protein